MFPDRYFPTRMFAPRYWPKTGEEEVAATVGRQEVAFPSQRLEVRFVNEPLAVAFPKGLIEANEE
jgi:hypothetical protein